MHVKKIELSLTLLQFEAMEALFLTMRVAPGSTYAEIKSNIEAIRTRLDAAKRLSEKFQIRET